MPLKRTYPAELKDAWTRRLGQMRKRLGWNYRNHWPFSWNYRLQRWLSKPAWCLITNPLGGINPKSVIRPALSSLQESKLFSLLFPASSVRLKVMHWNLFFFSFFSRRWSWEGITRTKVGHLCHGATVQKENYMDMCHMKALSFNIFLHIGIGQILWTLDLKTPVLICHILSERLITDARSTGEKWPPSLKVHFLKKEWPTFLNNDNLLIIYWLSCHSKPQCRYFEADKEKFRFYCTFKLLTAAFFCVVSIVTMTLKLQKDKESS